MKTLTSKQRKYLQSLLGKLFWIRDRQSDKLSPGAGESIVDELIEILYKGEYHEGKSEWINSLTDIYSSLEKIEENILRGIGTQHTLDTLKSMSP